VKKLHWK